MFAGNGLQQRFPSRGEDRMAKVAQKQMFPRFFSVSELCLHLGCER